MFEECFAALTHPLPTLFLIIYMGKEKTFEILRKHQKEFFQFYRSNRLRGHDTKPLLKELQQVMVVIKVGEPSL